MRPSRPTSGRQNDIEPSEGRHVNQHFVQTTTIRMNVLNSARLGSLSANLMPVNATTTASPSKTTKTSVAASGPAGAARQVASPVLDAAAVPVATRAVLSRKEQASWNLWLGRRHDPSRPQCDDSAKRNAGRLPFASFSKWPGPSTATDNLAASPAQMSASTSECVRMAVGHDPKQSVCLLDGFPETPPKAPQTRRVESFRDKRDAEVFVSEVRKPPRRLDVGAGQARDPAVVGILRLDHGIQRRGVPAPEINSA